MPATPTQSIDLSPEPDLHPLYPTIALVSTQISSHSGLTPEQRAELITHSLTRACGFGDLALLQFLLNDPQAQAHVDLSRRDDDGVGLISMSIHGFGGDLDRDVEREECVRLLVSQGAYMEADQAGWTPLHYAALLAPPTLVSYLMTHGCSPFDQTERKLTPLDIVTAHSIVPGREDVALLLEEAMRSQGWTGGHMEEKRRSLEVRLKKKGKRKEICEDLGRVLDLNPEWWRKDSEFSDDDDSDSGEEDDGDDAIYTPRLDYSSMLVFSPATLPHILDSLIMNYRPKFKDATPANTLYMLARFAALTCDHNWLEDLIIGATDAIEESFFSRAEDLQCLVFWLYNTTLWLHLLQCDNSINEACEMLGSFELIEEVVNSVFVFIIRFAERRIDQLLDTSILSYTHMPAELDAVQFESEWAFLRPFSSKKKPPPSPQKPVATPGSPTSPNRPISPTQSQSSLSSATSRGFGSLRDTIGRSRGGASVPSLAAIFQEPNAQTPSPADLTSFLTSLHLLLVLSDINPSISAQLWSQVMYWTSCELFNRVITRKKYLCRSRAVQIALNLVAIDEWIEDMDLPAGILTHFAPVRDLLNWLQRLSSITEFPDLVATIQTMKHMNPLQMRRAVRDYKYEVNESKMTDECVQYLTQLQKDWERHRVKLGVEAIRKEITNRDQDRESVSSLMLNDAASIHAPSITPSSSDSSGLQNIDVLFDKTFDKSLWEPTRPPQALGELLDSRFMIPLLFPTDPRHLAALPGRPSILEDNYNRDKRTSVQSMSSSTSSDKTSIRSLPFSWRSRNRKVREVGVGTLQWVDGIGSASRYGRPVAPDYEPEKDERITKGLLNMASAHVVATAESESEFGDQENEAEPTMKIDTHVTHLTRRPSGRAKNARPSLGDTTPIDGSFEPPPSASTLRP